jgi:hypothetical protein
MNLTVHDPMDLCERAGLDLFLPEDGELHVEGQARPDQQGVIDANFDGPGAGASPSTATAGHT